MSGAPQVPKSGSPTLDLSPLRGFRAIGAVFEDMFGAFSLLPLALALGWLDIKLRYRGSILGPFWLTISTAVMIGALGAVYGTLFHMDLRSYLPFLSLSLVLWGYISTLVNEAPSIFSQNASALHAMRMPLMVNVLRAIIRNTLILLHNVVVVALVFAFFRVIPQNLLSVLPALVLWIVDSMAVCVLLGLIGARFRDMPPLVSSVIQICFFVTPVIWKPSLIHAGAQYLLIDPFYPLLEIIRAPLLGEVTGVSIWAAAMVHSLLVWILAIGFLARFRARVAYWI
ncbi:ABC transporter permease [Brytella acorum]|uniref:ABC transporter permease n=1 Tax=Brytella acorum TaxID=2959299 RepID=A0AA35UR21_9PROT|nr:ABC transporter permease [Brytella acorum]MDF3626041.1 ABC transporter permease [Brytella acorum]CAI9122142.1 ABC transporter permease [Brytella acorum]